MLALPLLSGDSVLEITGPLESGGYVDLTRAVLAEFGVRIELDGPDRYRVPGKQRYAPAAYTVEGDWSQAAFFLTAGVLGGDVRVDGLRMDSAQGDRVIVDILRSMGADVRTGEGGARARRSALQGRDVDVSQCPDLAPAVAAALALSEGEGRVTGAGRLRLKESDRIASIVGTLGRLGARIRDEGDTIAVRGVRTLRGGAADSCSDHRIAMMAACVSVRCENAVNLTGAEAVNKSYPGFWDDLVRLGGVLI
jgi:3-phosphoshikimate 1-carboxyvinyltransferase